MMRFYRRWQTLILALLTFLTFVGSAIFVFDVNSNELWAYLLNTLLLLVFLVMAALLSVLMSKFFRKRR